MTAGTAVRTWAIRPEIPYVGVHSLLLGDGWSGGPVTVTPPLVRDEPELARYRREEEVATYELDPVAWLRLFRSASRPPRALPLLGEKEILALLDLTPSDEVSVKGLLLGVVAAGELGLAKAVPRLLRVRQRRVPPIVAGAAAFSLSRIARDREAARRR